MQEQPVGQLEDTIGDLKFDQAGLIPVVCIDADNRDVLMVAYMNQASLLETVRSGKTHFWSRSRQKFWMKGESSGHTQEVKAIYTDCDKDTLVVEVTQHGAACHKGYRSCFYRRLNEEGSWDIISEKIFDPDAVYGKKDQG
jgi:phosphoribosyl-AMP cyclohydrolase